MRASPPPRFFFVALVLSVSALVAGCATPTSTRTTVVLMPDEDNTVGALSISTASGMQRLDKAFSYASVNGPNAPPSKARTLGRATVNVAYGTLLQAQPPKPRTFILYFNLDLAELTEASKALLPSLFSAVRARKPGSITVFGHADATGSQERNVDLSADRAEATANLLRANDPTLKDIDVQYFGDTQPLTKSGPRVSEPRNRRVEILLF